MTTEGGVFKRSPGWGRRGTRPRLAVSPRVQSTESTKHGPGPDAGPKLHLGMHDTAGPASLLRRRLPPRARPQRRSPASPLGQDEAGPVPRSPSRGGGRSCCVRLRPPTAGAEAHRASAGRSVRDSPARLLLGSPTRRREQPGVQEQPSYRFASTKWR